jgi:hypothetical protein
MAGVMAGVMAEVDWPSLNIWYLVQEKYSNNFQRNLV